MKHNDYIFSNAGGQFTFLRRFEDMYRNCDDPHGQSRELERIDYHLVTTLVARALAQVTQGGASASILDIGCGLGIYTAHLKKLYSDVRVSGCDISPTAVARARKHAPDCEFFAADLRDGTWLRERASDVLTALDVLYYFTDDEIGGVVRNLHALIRGRGFLIFGYHLPEKMSFGRYIRSVADARALFEANGFALRLSLDVSNHLDLTYAGDPVGRHIYCLAQKGF